MKKNQIIHGEIQSRDAMKRIRALFYQCRTFHKHGFGLISAPLLTASFDVEYLFADKKLHHLVRESVFNPVDVRRQIW